MHSNLSYYRHKINLQIYVVICKPHRNSEQKCTVDNTKDKGLQYTTKKHQTTKEEKKRKQRGTTKQPENNEQNGNMYIPINNYFKCKWTKFYNQKIQSGSWIKK